MALCVIDFFQIRVIRNRFNPFLQGNDLIITGHHDDCSELQALGEMHGANRNVAAGRFDFLVEYLECEPCILDGRARPIQRLLLPEAVLEECVADAAWDAFAHAGLTRTPGDRGVLLFAALFERRVVVLGDEGIDREREPDESWQRAAEAVAVAARDEGLAAGLLAGIRACGELIVRHAPGSAGAPGERPPPVRLED